MNGTSAMNDQPGVSLRDQLRCVEREIALRQAVYPRWVRSGRMKADIAEREIAAMTAVLGTLRSAKEAENAALFVGDERA